MNTIHVVAYDKNREVISKQIALRMRHAKELVLECVEKRTSYPLWKDLAQVCIEVGGSVVETKIITPFSSEVRAGDS